MNRRESATKMLPAFLACVVLILCFVAVGAWSQTNLITPAQYLASLPKPNFAQGTRLPHLTRWGWNVSSNAAIELANDWGYALEISGYMTPAAASNAVHGADARNYGLIQLAKNNPAKYKLSILIDRTFPAPIPDDFYCTNSAGIILTDQFGKVVSPEGPDIYWRTATAYWLSSLLMIQSNAPISIILNGGEYGLNVPGFDKTFWLQDPRTQATTNGMTIGRYSSNRKAHQLGFLTAAIEQTFTNRILSIFYNTGAEENRTLYAGGEQYLDWAWNSDVMVTNTDLPSFEDYYTGLGSWTNDASKATANPAYADLLTKVLNAKGYNIALGHPLDYSWVSGGWGTDAANLSDIPRYYGFLKCLYTAGMVGGVAGYFDYPAGGFDASFPTNNPPHWLLQMIALSRVHALFSRLNSFLYDGDLLPGGHQHLMAGDQPAYEFTNTAARVYDRVLARKLRTENKWLICAWAADGVNTNVTVNVPTLGNVTVLARDSGAVYEATTTNLTMVDVNGLLSTQTLRAPPNLRAVSGSTN